jgi:hypothetical protein
LAKPHLLTSGAQNPAAGLGGRLALRHKGQPQDAGYRWNDGTNGLPKSWFVEVAEDVYEAELKFLRQEIYRREVEPFTQRITAFDRFRATP